VREFKKPVLLFLVELLYNSKNSLNVFG